MKKKVCVICGKEYKEWGNNAEPVKEGQCCDKCNDTKVIPARLANHYGIKRVIEY